MGERWFGVKEKNEQTEKTGGEGEKGRFRRYILKRTRNIGTKRAFWGGQ